MSDPSPDEEEPGQAGEPIPEDIPLEHLGGIWVESGVVLITGVVPYWCTSLCIILWPDDFHTLASPHDSLLRIVVLLQAMAPAAYFMLWSRHLAADGALLHPRISDLALGLGICLASMFAWRFLIAAFPDLYLFLQAMEVVKVEPGPKPVGWGQHFLVGSWLILNGLSEEVVMRGCLLPRFEKMFGSTLSALVLSSFLFAGYHLYQGPIGVYHALVFGLIFGGFFCWLRRIWPLAVAHAIYGLAMEYVIT